MLMNVFKGPELSLPRDDARVVWRMSMDFSKRCGSLALATAMLAFSGCKTTKETLSPSLVPPPPQEEDNSECTSCSVTCPNPDLEPVVDTYEMSVAQKQDLLAKRINDITTIDVHNSLGGKVPSYNNKECFFAMLEFLLWKAEEDGLEYAATMTPTGGSTEQVFDPESGVQYYFSLKEKLVAPNFTWGRGLRAGLGYRFGMHDNWDIDLLWTFYYNKARSSTGNNTQNLMFPTWGGAAYTDPNAASIFSDSISPPATPLISTVFNASAEWAFHYNILDLELGRHYFITKAFSVRPLFGVRGGFINQDYNVHYTQTTIFFINELSEMPTAFETPASMDADNNFHGIGPRLGLDLQWHINCHWSIAGKLSGSLLYGPFRTHQLYTSVLTLISSGDNPTYIYTHKRNYNRFAPNLEAALGFQWDRDFQRINHLSLGLFYDISEWFRQNHLVRNLPWINEDLVPGGLGVLSDPYVKEHGNLGLHGLTIKARVDF